MSVVAAILNVPIVGLCVFLVFNWATMAPRLELSAESRRFPEAVVSIENDRTVVALLPSDTPINVPCANVPRLCAELKAPIRDLEVWLQPSGFLAGDWIARARVGDRELVSFPEQQQRYQQMHSFYSNLTIALVVLALATGYVAYFRRAKS